MEAVWWIKDTGTQWRIKGEAFVVGRDVDEGESSGVRTVKSEVGRRMRRTDREGNEKDWSWAKELTAHFGNCSPGMRGMFYGRRVFRKNFGGADWSYRDLEESTTRETYERAGAGQRASTWTESGGST